MSKIDLIIDALERANELWLTEPMGEQAIAAAYELKALRPVAWIKRPEKVGYKSIKLTFDPPEDNVSTPLYALDEVMK